MHLAIELAAVAVACVVVTCLAAGDAAGAAAGDAGGVDVWIGCALGWTLLALAWIDAEHLLLPDVLTLPLIVAGLLAAWWREPWALTDRAAGAIAGYVAFRLIELG